jgi:hypothetical protein
MAADIARELKEMESLIISAIKLPEPRVEAVPQKPDHGNHVPDSDVERIQAGH